MSIWWRVVYYFWNWLALGSRALNVLLGGHPDSALSDRLGAAWLAHRGKGTRADKVFTTAVKVVNALFRIFGQRDHISKMMFDRYAPQEAWSWGKPSKYQLRKAHAEYESKLNE